MSLLFQELPETYLDKLVTTLSYVTFIYDCKLVTVYIAYYIEDIVSLAEFLMVTVYIVKNLFSIFHFQAF